MDGDENTNNGGDTSTATAATEVSSSATSSTPAAAAAPAVPPRKNVANVAQEAHNRASARKAAAASKTKAPVAGQAAVSQPKPADAGKGGDAGTQATAAATPADQSTGAATAGSTDEAPKDWPQEDRELYAKLPADGRQLVLDQYKRMQAGLTRANESLAQQRNQLGALSGRMTELQVAPDEVLAVVNLAVEFETDPQKVLTQLAQQKGIKLHFGDAPAAAASEEIPEFGSTKELYEHLYGKVRAELTAERAKTESAAEQQRNRDARMQSLRGEFSQARTDFSDFGTHEQTIIGLMRDSAGGRPLTVAHAYRLATYDALAERAKEVDTLKTENATLKQQIEAAKKSATRPATSERGEPRDAADKFKSPAQRAHERASRRRAAAN